MIQLDKSMYVFAGVAQLVEHQPSKLRVASSSLVSRSFLHRIDFFENIKTELHVTKLHVTKLYVLYDRFWMQSNIMYYLLFFIRYCGALDAIRIAICAVTSASAIARCAFSG